MLYEGWDIYEPCGTEYLHKINHVTDQKRIKTNIWCVKKSNRHYNFIEHETDMFSVNFDNTEQVELDYIEFLFNTQKDGYFLYARNNAISMDLGNAIMNINGIPCLAPEFVLLYKSTAANVPEYQLDFSNAISKMNGQQKEWLNDGLSIMFPAGHMWLQNPVIVFNYTL